MKFDRRVYFITVAKTRNISKAAQILHISQPSLSQYISRTEKDLGLALLDRSTSPFVLTEAGEVYLSYLKETEKAKSVFLEKIERLKARYSDSVTIGIPAQLFPSVFKDYIAGFMKKYPDVNIVTKAGTSISVRDMLIRGEVDIAFFHTTENNPGLVRKDVYEEKLFLSCNASRPFLRGRGRSRKEPVLITPEISEALSGLRFLQPSEEYLLSSVTDMLCEAAGLNQRKVQHISDIKSIADFIASPGSDGVSVLPAYLEEFLSDWENIAFLSPENNDCRWAFTMAHLGDADFTETEKLFWRSASEVIEKQRKV